MIIWVKQIWSLVTFHQFPDVFKRASSQPTALIEWEEMEFTKPEVVQRHW